MVDLLVQIGCCPPVGNAGEMENTIYQRQHPLIDMLSGEVDGPGGDSARQRLSTATVGHQFMAGLDKLAAELYADKPGGSGNEIFHNTM